MNTNLRFVGMARLVALLGALSPFALAQAIEPAQRTRAEELLRAHAERSRPVAVLLADYVQRRTTPLAKEPLVSSGEFQFVREPACVLFRATKPDRKSVV